MARLGNSSRLVRVASALGPGLQRTRPTEAPSAAIGFVLPDIANPFFARLAGAVEAAADACGLGAMLFSSFNQPRRELEYLARSRRSGLSGMMFATNHADDGTLKGAVEDVPCLVLLDEDVAGAEVSKVFSDNRQGGHLAALHMIECGHRSLAYIGGPRDLMSARERGAGFAGTIGEAGPGFEVAARLHGDYSRRHGAAAARTLLDDHPDVTAVFVGSDEILVGLLSVLRERGLRAGADLSIVTFDDATMLDFVDPPITAIRQPIEEIGRVGVECLLDRDIGTEPSRVERLPVGLMVRDSVCRPKCGRGTPKGGRGRRSG